MVKAVHDLVKRRKRNTKERARAARTAAWWAERENAATTLDQQIRVEFDRIRAVLADVPDARRDDARRWLLDRMRTTRRELEERARHPQQLRAAPRRGRSE